MNKNFIYTPIGNADFVGNVKIQNIELTNQQFFNTIFTRFVSVTLPVSEEKKSSHLQFNLYSDRQLTNLIKTIDTTNSEDRERVFGIDSNGFFNIPESGFNSSYQGKPIFVDLQEYYYLTSFVSWRVKMSSWGEKFYSVFPSMNIDNYGNGGISPGGTEGGFKYEGYFAVTDISSYNKDVVNISSGVVYLNNKRYEIEETEFELIDNLTGYVIDTDIYDGSTETIDTSNVESVGIIYGEITIEKLDPSYVIDRADVEFPCELRLVASNYEYNVKTYYTLSKNNRTDYSTDALIATIDKNDDGTLHIRQQQFGEISLNIFQDLSKEIFEIKNIVG